MSRMKNSGVEWIGEIPSTWNILRNKYLFEYVKGKNPENINNEGLGLPYIGASDLEKDGYTHKYINYSTDDLNECDFNDTLLLWDGARAGLIGTGHRGIISSTVVAVRPNNKQIDTKYLFWYFKAFQPRLLEMVGGTTVPHMSRDYIEEIMFLDIGIEEQRKIATYLDQKIAHIDNIIEKTKDSIEDYKKLKQSIITETVTKGLNLDVNMKDTGIEWIGKIPEHWETKKIKYIFEVVKRIANDLGLDVLSITQEGLKVKNTISNEGQQAADYSKYQFVHPGDFAMNHMDLLTGWVDISSFKGVTSPDYRVFRLKKEINYSKEYYLYIFQTCYSNRIFYGLGQGVSNLGRWRLQTEPFLNFVLPIPPKDEQEAIVNVVREKTQEVNKLLNKKQELIELLETYKKSLIYEVVTGKKEIPTQEVGILGL